MIDEQNFEKRCGQAREGYITDIKERKDREAYEIANPPEVFSPMSPERLRAAANEIRARQGLAPLPEPV